jgi:SAM-dependent methyltransferase
MNNIQNHFQCPNCSSKLHNLKCECGAKFNLLYWERSFYIDFIDNKPVNFTKIEPKASPKFSDKLKIINKFIKNQSTVLDVGCGYGSVGYFIGKQNFLVGLDHSTYRLMQAKERGYNLLLRGDAYKIPFEDNLFDVVISFELIEHLLDPKKLLSEINRVLKENGAVILSTPNLSYIFNRLSLLFGSGKGFFGDQGIRYPDQEIHIRFFTFRSLKNLLSKHGFKVVYETGAHFPLPITVFPKILQEPLFSLKLMLGKAFKSFSRQIFIVAKKTRKTKSTHDSFEPNNPN